MRKQFSRDSVPVLQLGIRQPVEPGRERVALLKGWQERAWIASWG